MRFPTRREGLLGLTAAGALAGGRPARAAPAPRAVDIGLNEVRSRFFLDVAINGEPGFRFVLDTGASAHFVSRRVAERMALPEVSQRFVQAFDGRKSDAVVQMSALRVGGVDLGRTEAIAWAEERLEGHDGLIGYPYLAPRAIIALGEGKLSLGVAADRAGVPVRAEVDSKGAILIGGPPEAEGRFAFDTGAQNFTISRRHYERLIPTETYRQASKLMVRLGDGEERVIGFRPTVMRFGAFMVENPMIHIAPDDRRQGVFDKIDGLIGVSLLRRHVWAIDTAGGRLSVLA